MKDTFTREELFQNVRLSLFRISPHVVTEMDKPETKQLFNQLLPTLEPYVLLEHIVSPASLYDFIQAHKNDLIIVTDDAFAKRKNYLDVLEGAICSSPDSGSLWPVRYLNRPEFYFKGRMILCTRKTRKEIKNDKRLEYFERDCSFL